jgi:MerR family transcriptional regulator, thiopeptide resistance regulator
MTGISVRALHHYDEIALLVPRGRTRAGYRLYDDADLLRLQQIVIGRELGLSLEEIRRSLDDPGFDRRRALLDQKKQLQDRKDQTEAMIRAVDAALAVLDEGSGDPMEMKSLFDGFDPSKYEVEANERWGKTDAYRESKRRTSRYSPEDWKKLEAEQAAIYGDAAAAMKAGQAPSDEVVMDIADRHRLSIDRWFNPCSVELHCGLAAMYEGDTRFAETIDRHGEGLTPFLVAAIRANAERRGG